MRPDELSLELTRVLPAPRERVFEFFSDAALLSRWWGPRGFAIPSIDFAPRVGATYRIEMQPPEGDAFGLGGTFRQVDAPARLAFSFGWQPADPDDVESVAELSFEPVGDRTEVLLIQGRSRLRRDGHFTATAGTSPSTSSRKC